MLRIWGMLVSGSMSAVFPTHAKRGKGGGGEHAPLGKRCLHSCRSAPPAAASNRTWLTSIDPPFPLPAISAEGTGDLLDNFVLAATDQGAAAAAVGEQGSDQEDDYSVVDSEEDEENEGESFHGASTAASDDSGAQLRIVRL